MCMSFVSSVKLSTCASWRSFSSSSWRTAEALAAADARHAGCSPVWMLVLRSSAICFSWLYAGWVVIMKSINFENVSAWNYEEYNAKLT